MIRVASVVIGWAVCVFVVTLLIGYTFGVTAEMVFIIPATLVSILVGFAAQERWG